MSLISDVKEEMGSLDLSRSSLRKFGLVVGAIFLLLGFWLLYRQGEPLPRNLAWAVGGVLVLTGGLLPALLGPVYRVWMGLAFTLGWVVSRVLLALIFYVIVTPISLIMRLAGKRPLVLKMDEGAPTYWIPMKKKELDPNNYNKMY